MKDTVLMVDGPTERRTPLFRNFQAAYAQHAGSYIVKDLSVGLPSEPRAMAAHYFSTLAFVLQRGGGALLENSWFARASVLHQLGRARVRLLERAALTAGALWADTGDVFSPRGLGMATSLSFADQNEPFAESVARVYALKGCSPAGSRGPGAGAWRPGHSVLLVADHAGTARQGDLKHRLPLYSFTDGGVAVWLANKLEEAGIPEEDLYWINAYDCNHMQTSSLFVTELKPRKIICMGVEAYEWAENQLPGAMNEVIPTPHPQHQKRFNFSEPYALIDAIKA